MQSVIPDNRLQALRTRLLDDKERKNPVHHPLFNLTTYGPISKHNSGRIVLLDSM